MLVVAKKGHEDEVRKILTKWELEAAVIGEVIAEPVYRVTEGDRVVAEFPGSRLVTDCPTYTPPARESDVTRGLRERDVSSIAEHAEVRDPVWVLEQLLASPSIASKRWVYRQYDTTVRTNTVIGPGGDAALVRLRGTDKAVALTVDCNGRYVSLDPRLGAKIAVAESARNVACTGARPRAITNNLNFGNPKRPEVYYQLREAIAGMAEACTALGTPVTGGNVSLYNENPQGAVHPTPVIGMVGVLDDVANAVTSPFSVDGAEIVLLGEPTTEIGASEYLARIHGVVAGSPPACDLDAAKRLVELLVTGAAQRLFASAHDTSEGGLAVALAECCMMDRERQLGATVDLQPWAHIPIAALLFGEAQNRVIVSTTVAPRVLAEAAKLGVPARVIGRVAAESQSLTIRAGSRLIDAPLARLAAAWHDAIPTIMSRSVAAAAAVITETLSQR
jgi:phosphoribosylformylglycinamidine synthase II